jgi:hypothetical protein
MTLLNLFGLIIIIYVKYTHSQNVVHLNLMFGPYNYDFHKTTIN